MKIKSKFYGEIEADEQDLICFTNGIPGFEKDRRFLYLHPENSVFGCLQSWDNPEIAFIVISPFTVCPDYSFDLDEKIVEELKVKKPEEILLLSIVTIPPGNVKDATVNLQAPVVINTTNRRGRQVILSDLGYPIRCRIWKEGASQAAVSGE